MKYSNVSFLYRHYDDEDSDLPFHPNKNLILEIFPESEYGWSKSAVEDYDSSTTESTESTESSSSESDSSSADDDEPHVVHRLNIASSSDVSSADDDDHVACILNAFNKKLKSGRRRIEDEEKEEEMDEDDLDDDWSDDLYDEIREEAEHKKHTSLGITRGGKRNTLEGQCSCLKSSFNIHAYLRTNFSSGAVFSIKVKI